MTYLSVRKWPDYQHYKDRQPIWIKLHVSLLDDTEMKDKLTPTTLLLWPWFLLLAARYGNAIPNDPEAVGKLTGTCPELCREAITELLKGRWLREKQTARAASKPASPRARPRGRERREEKPTTKPTKDVSIGDQRNGPITVWQDTTPGLDGLQQLIEQATPREIP